MKTSLRRYSSLLASSMDTHWFLECFTLRLRGTLSIGMTYFLTFSYVAVDPWTKTLCAFRANHSCWNQARYAPLPRLMFLCVLTLCGKFTRSPARGHGYILWKWLQFLCSFSSNNIHSLKLTCELTDLRDDKQFFSDHPGAAPITTSQVRHEVHLLYFSIYGST